MATVVPQTDAERRRLVEAPYPYLTPTVELLSVDGELLDDITDRVVDISVRHSNFADVHGTLSMRLQGALDWGRVRVRPSLTMRGQWFDTTYEDTRVLGTYVLTIPERPRSTTPTVYDVSGFDLIYRLAVLLPIAFTAPAGERVLSTVRQLLQARGFGSDLLNQEQQAVVMEEARSWPTTEDITDLRLINTLLDKVGYRGLYMDLPTGLPRSERYLSPQEQQPMWHYDAGSSTTTVKMEGSLTNDITDVPNRWVFSISRIEQEEGVEFVPTVENGGIYIFDNQSLGPSSQEARGGDVRTYKEAIEVDTPEELVAAAQKRIDADIQSAVQIELNTSANPYHGHFDVVRITDPGLGLAGVFQHMEWELNLLTGAMRHRFRSIEGVT